MGGPGGSSRLAISSAIASMGARFDESVLAATRDAYAPLLEPLPQVTESLDIPYGPDARQRIDLYRAGGESLPVVLFVHGGGFIAGDKRGAGGFYANVGRALAARGFLAATMNYRLAPAHGWPAGGEDVADAVDWLAAHAATHGGDPERVALVGQSAGGCHVATYLFDPALVARARKRVGAAVLMSGFYVPESPLRPGPLAYFGGDASQYAARSPASHVATNPIPLMLSVAEFDPAPLARQTLALATALNEARGACPPLAWFSGHNHVSTVMCMGTPHDDVGGTVTDFLRRELATRRRA